MFGATANPFTIKGYEKTHSKVGLCLTVLQVISVSIIACFKLWIVSTKSNPNISSFDMVGYHVLESDSIDADDINFM